MHINIRSRIANKVWLQLGKGKTDDFDMFFDLVHAIDWKKYVSDGQAVTVEVTTKNSILSSTRTLQSLTNKAIYKVCEERPSQSRLGVMIECYYFYYLVKEEAYGK